MFSAVARWPEIVGTAIPDWGWGPDRLASAERASLRSAEAIEFRVANLNATGGEIRAYELLRRVAWAVCDGRFGRANLVLVEHIPRPRSLVRWHKGLFYKYPRLRERQVQIEVSVGRSESVICALSPIDADNRHEAFDLAQDPFRSFVVTSQDLGAERAVELLRTVGETLDAAGSVVIDRTRLVASLFRQRRMSLFFRRGQGGDNIAIGYFFVGNADAIAAAMEMAAHESGG